MAKVRIITQSPIYDGIPLTFKAPCDCIEVDGLRVYYEKVTENASENVSQDFEFVDAHGQVLTGLGNLFSEGAYVRVILDTTKGYAYLQNANTNSYIESQVNSVPYKLISMVSQASYAGGTAIGDLYLMSFGGVRNLCGELEFGVNSGVSGETVFTTFVSQHGENYFDEVSPQSCFLQPITLINTSNVETKGFAHITVEYERITVSVNIPANTTKVKVHVNSTWLYNGDLVGLG